MLPPCGIKMMPTPFASHPDPAAANSDALDVVRKMSIVWF
jgi:hypothetical protein